MPKPRLRESSTMPSQSEAVQSDPLSSARRSVAELKAALLTPGATQVEACVPSIEAAITTLGTVTPSAENETSLRALKRELASAMRLIESGKTLNHALAELIAVASGGYTASGSAGPLHVAGSVSITG
jgi:hypothetical protein